MCVWCVALVAMVLKIHLFFIIYIAFLYTKQAICCRCMLFLVLAYTHWRHRELAASVCCIGIAKKNHERERETKKEKTEQRNHWKKKHRTRNGIAMRMEHFSNYLLYFIDRFGFYHCRWHLNRNDQTSYIYICMYSIHCTHMKRHSKWMNDGICACLFWAAQCTTS